MSKQNFIKKVSTIMRGKLCMPDQFVDFTYLYRFHRVFTIINMKTFLKINWILTNFIFNKKNKFFFLQQFPKIQTLEICAKSKPVRIMKINMIFPADPLAFPYRIIQIFQLILGEYIRRKDRLF